MVFAFIVGPDYRTPSVIDGGSLNRTRLLTARRQLAGDSRHMRVTKEAMAGIVPES